MFVLDKQIYTPNVQFPKRIKYPLWLSCAITLCLILSLAFFFDLRWQTNDDVVMSMAAHGYGIAAYGSPSIVFSNVVWGYFVRAIPSFLNIPGYTWGSLLTLYLSGIAIVYTLIKSNICVWLALSLSLLFLAQPILFPQFTVNSGLLSISAIALWSMYARGDNYLSFVSGCAMAFASYIVRSEMFFLMMLLGLPLIPWHKMLTQNRVKYGLLVLVVIIGFAKTLDWHSYQAPQWQKFNEFNKIRVFFTDIEVNNYLRHIPAALKKHQYSENDVSLIRHWFFQDQKISNPSKLKRLISEINPTDFSRYAYKNIEIALKKFFDPRLLFLVLVALLLLSLRPTKRIIISWFLCLSIFIIIGAMGRPAVLRGYLPVITLLAIAPFLVSSKQLYQSTCIKVIVMILSVGNLVYMVKISNEQSKIAYTFNSKKIPSSEMIYAWGAAFPYELLFKVLDDNKSRYRNLRIYNMGTLTFAPYSYSKIIDDNGRDMLIKLASPSGITIFLKPEYFKLLSIYCTERMDGKLKVHSNQRFNETYMQQLSCINDR